MFSQNNIIKYSKAITIQGTTTSKKWKNGEMIDIQLEMTKLHPDIEGIQKLRYVKNVFKETLRLYPPTWASGRKGFY